MAKRRFSVGQKQQKNLVAIVLLVVGLAALTLSTFSQWDVPAALATHSYADIHNYVSDFITYTGLGNGEFLMIGLGSIAGFGLLYRK